jgi:hypothetical protein
VPLRFNEARPLCARRAFCCLVNGTALKLEKVAAFQQHHKLSWRTNT